MQVTGFEDIKVIRLLVKELLKKYNSIKLNDIMESCDAPTNTGEEILIELFPVNYIDYKTETRVNEKYISDCHNLVDRLKHILKNEIATDISEDNNWAFIYIIF